MEGIVSLCGTVPFFDMTSKGFAENCLRKDNKYDIMDILNFMEVSDA